MFMHFTDALALALGYLLGSIPFGLLLTWRAGTADLRSIGSGNIGATNVLRTGRKDLATATLLLDALKGTVAVILGGFLSPTWAIYAGFFAFVGHVAPIWLRFKGGKGVATFLGCLFAINCQVGLIFCVIWLSMAAIWRYSSLAALGASFVSTLTFFIIQDFKAACVVAAMTLILFYKHRENIHRLRLGTESKIGQK
jgi:glycerol-3-phosphate acyltransferase PlsY